MAPRGAICTSSCQNRVLTGVYKRIYTVANTIQRCKSLTLTAAHATHSGRTLDAALMIDAMAQAWDAGIASIMRALP